MDVASDPQAGTDPAIEGSSSADPPSTGGITRAEVTTDAASGAGEDTATSESGTDEPAHERAAAAACAAREAVEAIDIPYGDGQFLENGFRLGDAGFPHRFMMDATNPNTNTYPGDYSCYSVNSPQDTESEWWFADDDWLDPDGVIRIYMVTDGIDDVIYYGPDEVGAKTPGAPVTRSVLFDVSATCPTLPQVWLPNIADFPERAGRICMRQTRPIAEAVFVRLP